MPTKKLTKKNQKFAIFKLGSDTLRITETEDGIEARVIAENCLRLQRAHAPRARPP